MNRVWIDSTGKVHTTRACPARATGKAERYTVSPDQYEVYRAAGRVCGECAP